MVGVLTCVCLLLVGALVYLYWSLGRAREEGRELLQLRALLSKQEGLTQQAEERERQLIDRNEQQQERLQALHTDCELLRAECHQLRSALEEQQATQAQLADLLEERFRGITTKILDERSEQMHRRNEASLSPLREDLKRFGEQVERAYNNEARERHSLQHEIRLLVEHSNKMSSDAHSLTQALRGTNKLQGNWGEMILEDLLRKSGLEPGVHYTTQEVLTQTESDKRLIPDVLVNYPNGGRMIIDSKVNLVDYMDYVNAKDEAEQRDATLRHIRAIRKQIKDLSHKHYQAHVPGAPDFVILFIPNEPAYLLAMKEDPRLWEEAYAQKILLMNTTNLMATLKMAEELWRNEKQRLNVQEIFRKVGDLYDQFVVYLDRMETVAGHLDKAQNALADTQKSLSTGRGNVLRRFEELRKLGVKTEKQIAQVARKSRTLSLDEDLGLPEEEM